MKSFRDYIVGYKDFVFNLDQSLTNPARNNYQNRGNCKFVVDDKTSLDWYNARLSINFKLTKLTGNNVIINDNNGIVNSASSFFKKISLIINGREVYQCNSANHLVNIKNLLEYNPSYTESVGTNEFYYLDTYNNPNRNIYQGKSNTEKMLQTMVGRHEILLKMKILLSMRGLQKEKVY